MHIRGQKEGDVETALSWAMGKEGNAIWSREAPPSLRERLGAWVTRAWHSMQEFVGIEVSAETKLRDLARKWNLDLRSRGMVEGRKGRPGQFEAVPEVMMAAT